MQAEAHGGVHAWRRYNVVTFVPRFLFEQFSQVAYFYFLIQVSRTCSS